MLNMDKPVGLFAIRMRIIELNLMYRRLLHRQPEDGVWDWWIKDSIRQLEADLTAAKSKMAFPVVQYKAIS